MRFEVQQIKFLPKITICKQPMFSNFDELIKIYPEMKHKILSFSEQQKQLIFENGLKQLLMDNRLNDFQKIAETEKILKTCHFVINNKLINCSKVDTGFYNSSGILMISNDLTYSGIVDKSKIEKITLSLNPFQILLVNIYLYLSNPITTVLLPKSNTRTKLSFSSFSVRKLNSIHNKCISEKELNNFGEDYFDYFYTDCYFKSLNQSYGCIHLSRIPVYFDRDILKNSFKFCKNSNVTIDSLKKIYTECHKRSKPKCNSINFNSKIETTNLLSNGTILEFILQKTLRIAYIETYKTNFDGFIYNCGGVLGLWFGLTPIDLFDILKYLPLISKILISKSRKFVHYLKTISIRFAQNSFGICKRFGHYLLGTGFRFAQNLIEICKRFGLYLFGIIIRFAQKSFGICKRFGHYLLGIGVRFAQNLIGICKRFGLYLFGIIIRFAQKSFGICKRFGHYLFRIGVRFAQNLFRICKRFALFLISNIITFAYNLIAIFMRFVRHLFRINSREY
jgi:hypothetical protein